MPSGPRSAPQPGGRPGRRSADRPRLLLYAMYDDTVLDRAPAVRIRLIGDALARQANVERIAGGRLQRVLPALRWLLGGGLGRIDAVYVESSTSTSTPIDLLLLGLARLSGHPVGVYFRDAYPLYRGIFPLERVRHRVLDLLWRVTTPMLRGISSRAFAPSEGLARTLGLRNAILLPPGTDPSLPDLGAGHEPLVAAMIDGGSTSGLELLLSAMVTVRSALGDVRLRVISQARPEVRDAPPWMEWSMAARGELPLLLGPARACVIPRGLNPYSDLAVPLKLMDYLSFGKPIIATDAAETASILERSGAGLVVDETPDALAAAIERVLSEPGLADRLASRARAFATLPGSTWDARASKILEHLVGSPRSGR